MIRMILTRTAYAVPALLMVSILVFLATQALPGDAAITALGKNATPQGLQTFREQFNLNSPLYVQYFDWLQRTLTGDLGNSFQTPSSVSGLIGGRVANSLILMLIAAVIAVPLAIGLGIYMASRRDKKGDHIVSTIMLVINSLPEFVVAVGIVILFATNVFTVLPAVSALDPNRSLLSQWDQLILPTATLILLVLPYVARTVRACLVEELDSDHIRMARLKGLKDRRIILRHALPNIAGPTLQVVAQSLAWLAGGILVVETVFQYPGVGQALVAGVQSRDIPVVQAITCLLAAFYIVINIVADIGTMALTPTLRRGTR